MQRATSRVVAASCVRGCFYRLTVDSSSAVGGLGRLQAALDELVAVVVDGGAAELSHEQLTGLVVVARGAQARLDAVVAACVGEVDARGSFVHEGALTAAAWLRRHTRVTPTAAHATVGGARVVRSGVLPGAAAALAAGEVSARHVQVLVEGVRGAPPEAVALIEAEAVELAREADVASVAALMPAFRHALDPDDADAAALRRYERRGFTLSVTLDRAMSLHGFADETSGALVATALDAAVPQVPGDGRTAA